VGVFMVERKRISLKKWLLILGSSLMFCCVGLFLFETFPRFNKFEIPAPTNDGYGHWFFPTYSIWTNSIERYYIWREQSTYINKKASDEESRIHLIDHFNKELLKYNWLLSDDYAPCRNLLPEGQFIHEMGEALSDGILIYRKRGYEPFFGSNGASDFVCLAIWNSSPGIYNIVFMSAKPSPITYIIGNID
jgi:hypothetical protein